MNSKSKKILLAIMVVAIMLVMPTFALATNPGDISTTSNVEISAVTSIGSAIISTVSTIASIVSILVLIILGIKYMMGSAEEKAEYKKTLIPYIVGAVLVFGASAIATAVYNLTGSLDIDSTEVSVSAEYIKG